MAQGVTISQRTKTNWLVDAAVFASAVLAILSGIFFLFVPNGGRSSLTVVLDRSAWSDLHLWGGVLMILAVIVHLTMHLQWVTQMSKRVIRRLKGEGARLSRGAKVNLTADAVIAVSFLLTAVSGVYFLFAPHGGYQGGRNPEWDAAFLWSRTTWDLIHTWAGVILVIAAVIHFVIHWRWIKNVTKRFFLSFTNSPEPRHASAR